MSVEENKDVVRKGIESFNQRNFDLMCELTAPDFVEHSHHYRGREAHRQFLNMHVKSFPDFHMEIEDMVAEGDKVWVRFKVTGTHTGRFQGLAPTGKKVAFESVQMYTVVDGKLAECWAVSDSVEFLRQLGAIDYSEEVKKILKENAK